ncbi:MAG TPA: site-2 protease family protein [Methylomirabilota bacterium]|nr:site-2 protease family protein [Methylomirabilota bacterium]
MRWSLKVGTFAGIGVHLHWTFLLFIGWVFYSHLGRAHDVSRALEGVGFVLALFTCVVLHEYGHALTARRFGVGTRDITLLPIGGVARLERIPKKPMQEFWVAIAGPAVNVVIALTIFLVLVLLRNLNQLFEVQMFRGHFLVRLMWVNVFLILFNLLPAFPMDGGRVLRALLATQLGRPRATAIAARVGQGMAILFALVGFFYNPMLMFIALFVYLGAQAEAEAVATDAAVEGLRVEHAMMTRFRCLAPNDTLEDATRELLAGAQQDFPVVHGGQVVGLLRRNDLVRGLTESGPGTLVADAMWTDVDVIDARKPLDEAFRLIQQGQCGTVPVTRDGSLVGLLTLENLGELVMVNTALRRDGS